jgi:hypothetical protein
MLERVGRTCNKKSKFNYLINNLHFSSRVSLNFIFLISKTQHVKYLIEIEK